MAWVRLDDHFDDHPKVVRAGPLGMALYVAALCYSNRNLTDGFVPHAQVPRLIGLDGVYVDVPGGVGAIDRPDLYQLAERLVECGLWERAEGGYRIHDYLDYQPSRAEVLAEREAARERMARARAKRSQEVRENFAGTSGEVPETFARSSDNPNPNPNPVLEEREREPARAHEDSQDLPDWRRWYEQRFASIPPERWRLEIDEKIEKGMHPDLVIAALEAAIEAKAEHPLSWANSKLAAWFARGIRSPDDLEADKRREVKDRGSTRAESKKRDYRAGKYGKLFAWQDSGDGAGPDGGRDPPA